MRLLILGGTEFVGRSVAEAALARGWDVTLFNRGSHDPLPGTRQLTGDRTAPGGLAALEEYDGAWDAVVDTWTSAPRVVLEAARALRERAGRYAYVSSRSVYAWPWPVTGGPAEDGALVEGAAADAEATEYGQDKLGGELAAIETFGAGRALLLRAGLILGPYENSGRLPYWLSRIARGGKVLAPGPRERPLQFVDARDLSEWLLDALEQGLGGPYDVASPAGHTTMGELLDACVRATGSDAELCWAEPETVLAAGIEPWTGMPVWTPPDGELAIVHQGDASRALAAGLTCRPAEETVAGTWRWLESIGGTAPQRADRKAPGPTPEQEAEALRLLDKE